MMLGGVYLNALYVAHWKEQMKTILSEAWVFGIAVFGDGATIKTVQLVNVLAACINNPFALLKITDCTAHLAKGGKEGCCQNHYATHSAGGVRGGHAQEDVTWNRRFGVF